MGGEGRRLTLEFDVDDGVVLSLGTRQSLQTLL